MFHWMEREVLPCNLGNDVFVFKPCSACNNEMFKQDKPISTNSTVIKWVQQKLKSKKKCKFAFIGTTVVKSTRKLQNVGCIAPVISGVHVLMFIFVCFCKSI